VPEIAILANGDRRLPACVRVAAARATGAGGRGCTPGRGAIPGGPRPPGAGSPGPAPAASARAPRRSGTALIAALWVVLMLAMMVGSFAFHAHVEARLTSYYRNRAKAEYIARSGLEYAEMIMDLTGRKPIPLPANPADPAPGYASNLVERGYLSVAIPIGEGVAHLQILPEPAKRNVNLLSEEPDFYGREDWERIFELTGVPDAMWPELIDQFYDWIDPDRNSRYDGAESEAQYDDYCHAVGMAEKTRADKARSAKNAPLDTVGELLLIPAFSDAILNGGDLNTGLPGDPTVRVSGVKDLLTTYGDGKVNVNAAAPRVLMTLSDVDSNLVERIVEQREYEAFKDVADVTRRVPGLSPQAVKFMDTASRIYEVVSVGEAAGVRKGLRCVVEYAGQGKRGRILQWHEDDGIVRELR